MKTSQLKAGIVLSYGSLIIGNLIALIYTPIMLRLLGQSEYGMMNLSVSVTSYLGLLTMGLGSAYVRFNMKSRMSGDKEAEYNLNGMYITVYTILAIVSLIFGLIFALNCDLIFAQKFTVHELTNIKILIVISVVNISISLPFSIFHMSIMAYEKFVFAKVTAILGTVVSPFVTLPLLFLGYKSIGLTVASVILNFINIAVTVLYAKRTLKFKIKFNKMQFSIIKTILSFSVFIFFQQLADLLNWNIDKFILGVFKGTSDVAIYAIGSSFNTYFIAISIALSGVFVPRINQYIFQKNQDHQISKLFNRIGRIQFIILSLFLTGFIIFGKQFILFWAGPGYEQSYYIALFLIVPLIFPLTQNIAIEVERAKNIHRFRTMMYLIVAIVNSLISIPLCITYGGVGCAFGTSLSMIIGAGILVNIYIHKKVGLNVLDFWMDLIRILPALIVPVVVGVLMNILIDFSNIVSFLICGIIFIVVFLISMWFIGMNPYEKELVFRLMRKFSRKKEAN